MDFEFVLGPSNGVHNAELEAREVTFSTLIPDEHYYSNRILRYNRAHLQQGCLGRAAVEGRRVSAILWNIN